MRGVFISNELTEARIIRALDKANIAFDPDAEAEREPTPRTAGTMLVWSEPWLSVNLDMLCFNQIDPSWYSRSFLENL